MMTPRPRSLVVGTSLALGLLACAPAPVEARQFPGTASSSSRPTQGVFARDTGNWQQALTLSASFGTGWDKDLVAGATGREVLDRGQVGGTFGSGSGSLAYSVNRSRLAFGATVASAVRYYGSQLSRTYVTAHSGGLQASLRLTARTQLGAQLGVAFQPFDSRLLGAGDPFGQPLIDTPDLDTTTGTDNYLSMTSGVNLGHRLSERSSLQFGYAFRRSDYVGIEQSGHGANAGYTLGLTKNLGLRLGYGYIQDRFLVDTPGAGQPIQPGRHVIDAGINYGRGLSLSRRTTLGFGTGVSAVNDLGATRYNLTGNANLSHELGRSWSAAAGYGRSVEFVDILYRPRLSDSVIVSLGGLINRRLSFQSQAGASYGAVGFGNDDNKAIFYRASAGLVAALNRYTGLGLTYAYYQHDFGADVVLPRGILRRAERQVVQFNIHFWAPLLRRAGRLDAAR